MDGTVCQWLEVKFIKFGGKYWTKNRIGTCEKLSEIRKLNRFSSYQNLKQCTKTPHYFILQDIAFKQHILKYRMIKLPNYWNKQIFIFFITMLNK